MHWACNTCYEHDHHTCYTYGLPGWRGLWGGREEQGLGDLGERLENMREGLEKIWEVWMCLSLCEMTIYDSVWWSEVHMSCQHTIGHLSSKLFKVQISRIMSFGWQNVCVIDIESKWEHRNFVEGVLWYKWCSLNVDCRDFTVWHDTVRLTRWLSQGKSDKTSLPGALCCKTDVMYVVHMWYSTDVVKVHAWCNRVLPWSEWQDQPAKSSLPGITHTQSSTMIQPLWVV